MISTCRMAMNKAGLSRGRSLVAIQYKWKPQLILRWGQEVQTFLPSISCHWMQAIPGKGHDP